MAHVAIVTYRPLLLRLNRENWKIALIFPVFLVFGGGLMWWTLTELASFANAVARRDVRLAWDPADIRGFAAGLALFAFGLLPLFPVSDEPKRRGDRQPACLAVTATTLAACCLVLAVFGPMVARWSVQSAPYLHGYRQCPLLSDRHSTLRWVRIVNAPSTVACPTRWQEEWF